MAGFPAGVVTAPVELSVSGFDGKSLGGRWTIEPSRPLLWQATRQPVLARTLAVTLAGVPQLSTLLPVTGQPGFVDPVTGAALTGWGYNVTYRPLRSLPVTATGVQVAAGQTTRVGALLPVLFWPHAEHKAPGQSTGVVFGREPDGRVYALVPDEFIENGRPFIYATPDQIENGRPVITL